jgi:hypothetical protein
VEFAKEDFGPLQKSIPTLLTPGAAEALAVKIYRTVKTQNCSPLDALHGALNGYQNPVPLDVMNFQIAIAAREASDGAFVPECFRALRDIS